MDFLGTSDVKRARSALRIWAARILSAALLGALAACTSVVEAPATASNGTSGGGGEASSSSASVSSSSESSSASGGGSTASTGAGGGSPGSCADPDAPWTFDALPDVQSGFAYIRRRVWGTGPTDVWILGPKEDEVHHFDGATWSDRYPALAGFVPYAVTKAWPSTWLAGSSGTLLVDKNDAWSTIVPAPALALESPSLCNLPDGNLFAAGASSEVFYGILGEGGWVWDPEPLVGAGSFFSAYAVTGASVDDAFVAGTYGDGGPLYHRDASGWSPVPGLAAGGVDTLMDIWSVAPGLAFAVGGSFADGGGGTGRIARVTPDMASFEVVPMNAEQQLAMTGVWGSSATDVWAVGAARALHFDGTAWKVAPLPGEGDAFSRFPIAVWGASASDVFIAGSDGVWHCHRP